MSKKKRPKMWYVLWVLLIAFLILFFYFTIEVARARKATHGEISQALQSNLMRLALNELSQRQIDILLAVEDPKFYTHNGVDVRTPGAGMTTITQGLVKIHYFRPFKPGIRKIKQTLIARFALDPLVSKDDQLRLFINEVYMGSIDGEELRGFAPAAQAYYEKPFSEITEDEFIGLVAMIIGANAYNPITHPEMHAERVRRIKRLISGEGRPNGWMDVYLEGCK
jgi:membrane carboxypeptidase/penicillin-binding protein